MKKLMYSDDIKWYDQNIRNAIEALDDKHDNAIPVFGGALGAYNYINCDNPDYEKFVKCLPNVVHSAQFFGWYEGAVGALRRFCRLCLVDPALVEAYLGATFEDYARFHETRGAI